MRTKDLKKILALGFTSIIASYCHGVNAQESNKSKRKNILSFGGNGFIGSEVLSTLISTEEYNITVVSRGSWPSDSSSRVKPFVNFVHCDRERGIDNGCEELLEVIQRADEYYAILDFSGFDAVWVKEAVQAVRHKARVYIYISTDNVYEVCQRFPDEPITKGANVRKLAEGDAVRPTSKVKRENLNGFDEYGDNKLQCEEYLEEQRNDIENGGVPFVSLRLADVIGPRDESERFSTYFVWLKFHHVEGVPHIHVPNEVLETTSLTYLPDIVQSVTSAMHTPSSWDEAYNIACAEVFNVTNAIETIADSMGKHNIQVHRVDSQRYGDTSQYPGVTRAPLDITKAIYKLAFNPTPLHRALNNTLAWFENAYNSDEDLKNTFIEDWINNVLENDDSSDDNNDLIDSILDNIVEDMDKDEL